MRLDTQHTGQMNALQRKSFILGKIGTPLLKLVNWYSQNISRIMKETVNVT